MKNRHIKSDITVHKQSTPAYNSRRSSTASIRTESNKSFQKSFVFSKNSYSTVYIDKALEAARKLLQENVFTTNAESTKLI